MKAYFKNEKKPICIDICIHNLKYINIFLTLYTKCSRKLFYVLQCAANRNSVRTTALHAVVAWFSWISGTVLKRDARNCYRQLGKKDPRTPDHVNGQFRALTPFIPRKTLDIIRLDAGCLFIFILAECCNSADVVCNEIGQDDWIYTFLPNSVWTSYHHRTPHLCIFILLPQIVPTGLSSRLLSWKLYQWTTWVLS
jgi:hypothetical protein